MTYANLVKAAKKAVKVVDASIVKEHLAVEFDIEGKGEGAFYVEFKENSVEVEPYEYYDHDFRIRCAADTSLSILNGEISPVKASEDGSVIVEGNYDKLLLLENYLKAEVKEKKTRKTTKKATEEKAVTKKVADVEKKVTKAKKAVEEKVVETVKKTAAKKETEKKPVPKKVEKKPAKKTVK